MNYLFFDTEYTSFGQKIIEFGSIMTTDDFRMFASTRTDILVNPGKNGKFHFKGRKHRPDIELAHKVDEYRNAPSFREQYLTIKVILSQPNTRVIGWATENDILALQLASKAAFQQAKFSFQAYDVQAFYMHYMKPGRRVGLEKALDTLYPGKSECFQSHRPDQDAEMTAYVLMGLTRKFGKTLDEMAAEVPSAVLDANSLKSAIGKQQANGNTKQYCREMNKVFESSPKEEDVPFQKRFSLSAIVKAHPKEAMEVAKLAFEKSYSLCQACRHASFIIAYDGDDEKRLAGELDLTNLKVLLLQDFKSQLAA